MRFNIDDYKGKYVIHCKTEKEAKDFCDYLNSIGKKNCMGKEYHGDSLWIWYKDALTINFNEGCQSDISYYRENNYTILEWEDFMKHTFTKDDLRTGDVILRRDGDVEIFIKELKCFICNDGEYNTPIYINDDMTSTFRKGRDIMAVRRPKQDCDCVFSAFENKRGTLIYEREEVEEMTLAEVCKLLGKNIKIVKE